MHPSNPCFPNEDAENASGEAESDQKPPQSRPKVQAWLRLTPTRQPQARMTRDTFSTG